MVPNPNRYPDQRMYVCITVDVTDADAQASFWSQALPYDDVAEFGHYRVLSDSTGRVPRMVLQPVPEPRSAKNRLHLDLHVDDIDAEIDRLVAVGATRRQRFAEYGAEWELMADPEGNEFCICRY
jgi:predicted enzyme related to lactoylglutathione lyase